MEEKRITIFPAQLKRIIELCGENKGAVAVSQDGSVIVTEIRGVKTCIDARGNLYTYLRKRKS